MTSRPPGPRSGLFSKVKFQLLYDPLPLMERNTVYGDLVGMRIAGRNFYQLNHPDFIKHVLVDNQTNYIKSRALQMAQYVLGQGLLTSEGELHRRQRQVIQPAFHRRQVAGYTQTMTRLAADHFDRWQPGQKMDLHRELRQLTVAIVTQTLFGLDIAAQKRELTDALDQLVADFSFADATPLGQLLLRLPLPRHRRRARLLAQLDEVIYEFIAVRSSDSPTLLGLLLAASPRLNRTQIRDEVRTMFLAGHETTANALVWTFFLLAQHPEVAAQLHAELDTVLADRRPTLEDYPRLTYTRMVFAEALRLYPPVWAVGREAVADDEIGGYPVPAGSTLIMSQWVLHRDARFWPNPTAFDPERFSASSPTGGRPRYAYFPFGGGPRACIGERFAWTEGVLLTALLAQRFYPELAPEARVEPLAGITLRPKYGLPVRLQPRRA